MQFSHRSGVTWGDYLLTESATASINAGMRSQTQALVASQERTQQSMQQMSEQLQSGLAELSAAFNWGMSELLIAIGDLNDTLEQLIALARNPSQTWAYEQFNIARDAFKRHLFDDALTYVNSAIDGSASQTGYRLDHRFHMLLGLIRLGNHHSDADLIDLPAAEQAFLAAAKYAKATAPEEAGRAMLSAAWAAYCQAQIEQAESYVSEALALNSQLSEAHFLQAKLYMAKDLPAGALMPLSQAIALDRDYMLKVQDDPDFEPHQAQIESLYAQLVDSKKEQFAQQQQSFVARLEAIKDFKAGYRFLNADLSEVEDTLKQAAQIAAEGNYFAYDDALAALRHAETQLAKAKQQAVEQGREDIRNATQPKYRAATPEDQARNQAQDKGCLATLVIFVLWSIALYVYVKLEVVRNMWPTWYDPIVEMLPLWIASLLFVAIPLYYILKGVLRVRFNRKYKQEAINGEARREEFAQKAKQLLQM
jgi:hypothetical protein